MSTLRVTNLKGGSAGSAPNLPDGAVISGVITATSFSGSGANLTGIDATALKDGSGNVKIQANSDGAVVTGVLTAPTVSGTTGSFTGNVSVGGTLTYEDVTNVDSVGMVTARNGVKVLAGGIDAVGVVTATSYRGDGSQLSGIEAAPTIQLVADGAIGANKPVIIGSDGKVKAISGYSNAMGSEIVVNANADTESASIQIAEDFETGRVVYLFKNNGVSPNAAYYRVGTRAGTSITWGTAASLASNPCAGGDAQIVCIGTDKFFAIYRDWESHVYCRVISTTSSNTATLGTRVAFTDSSNNNLSHVVYPQLQFNSVTGNIMMAYGAPSGANAGLQARMASVSGTTVTLGSPVQITNEHIETMDSCWDPDKTSMITVFRWNNNQFWTALIKEPSSGLTPLLGTFQAVTTQTGGNHSVTYDSKNKVVISMYQRADNDRWQYYAGIWESGNGNGGTNNGSASTLNIAGSPYTAGVEGRVMYEPTSEKFLFVARDTSSDAIYVDFSVASGAGTNNQLLTQNETSTQFDLEFNFRMSMMKLGRSAAVLIPYHSNSGGDLRIRQYASTTMTDGNMVGFSKQAYTDGQTVTINVVGNTTTQSGLTPGKKYYVTGAATLSLTPDNPSVVAGRAISATQLLIQPG